MTLQSKVEDVDCRVSFEVNNEEYSLSDPESAIRQLAFTLEYEYGVPREAMVKWIEADIEVRDAKDVAGELR